MDNLYGKDITLNSANNQEKDITDNESGLSNNSEKKYEIALWNPKSFIVLSLLFSFLPAGILYSLNYGRLGYHKKKRLYLILSFVYFILFFVITNYLPDTVVRVAGAGINAGLGSYMMRDQLPLYKSHIAAGGKKASLLVPVIAGIIAVGVLLGGYIYFDSIQIKELSFGQDKVYYTNNVSEQDAQKLGNYLKDYGMFVDDNNKIAMKLDKDSDSYKLLIPINKDYIDNKDVIDELKELLRMISQNVFNNQKVKVDLCDENLNVLKTIE